MQWRTPLTHEHEVIDDQLRMVAQSAQISDIFTIT